MNKSKRIFAIVAAVMILLCICLMLLSRKGETSDEVSPTTGAVNDADTTAATMEGLLTPTELEDIVIPTIPTETIAPIVVSDDVTIHQVPCDPNEVIDRTSTIDPSHPEYIDRAGGDQYWSVEGKVCRNDKTIEIVVPDDISGKNYTITFGYATGKCNRFLYINPVIEYDGSPITGYLHFNKPIGGGYVVTISDDIPDDAAQGAAYTYRRAREQRSYAQYVDPKHPGAAWFPQNKLEGPIYLNMIIANAEGNLFATLRLCIDKEEDGTYSFVDIDNLNMMQNKELHPEYTEDELAFIVETVNDVYLDPAKSGFFVYSTTVPITPDRCIVEYRDKTTGLYYMQFLGAGTGTTDTKHYVDQQLPILAVTYRQIGVTSHTFYLQVVSPPKDGEHGKYAYIGRDYPLYDTVALLEGYGWDGIG